MDKYITAAMVLVAIIFTAISYNYRYHTLSGSEMSIAIKECTDNGLGFTEGYGLGTNTMVIITCCNTTKETCNRSELR